MYEDVSVLTRRYVNSIMSPADKKRLLALLDSMDD
jgi:hypothetical protein